MRLLVEWYILISPPALPYSYRIINGLQMLHANVIFSTYNLEYIVLILSKCRFTVIITSPSNYIFYIQQGRITHSIHA